MVSNAVCSASLVSLWYDVLRSPTVIVYRFFKFSCLRLQFRIYKVEDARATFNGSTLSPSCVEAVTRSPLSVALGCL